MFKKIPYLFFIITGLLFSCAWLSKRTGKEINGIVLEWRIPLFNPKLDKINFLADSCLIYYFDDLIMVRIPLEFTKYSKIKKQGDTTFILEQSNDLVFTRFRNFIYKKTFPKGLIYDSVTVKNNIIFNVDSLLRKSTFKNAIFFNHDNDLLIEQKLNSKTGLILEKYVPKIKFDESYNDTTYFVFDPKFKAVDFSLSKEADSLRKMKLVEVRLSYNAKPKTVDNLVAIPKREFSFKIKELKINNQKEIIMLFNRFRKDSEKINLQ